jgi:hypothetical protein
MEEYDFDDIMNRYGNVEFDLSHYKKAYQGSYELDYIDKVVEFELKKGPYSIDFVIKEGDAIVYHYQRSHLIKRKQEMSTQEARELWKDKIKEGYVRV